jgi:hypothetical protein
MQSEKSGVISDGCLNTFNRLSKQNDSLPVVLNLFDQIESGNVESSDYSRGLFARFLKAIESSEVKIISNESPIVNATPVDIPKTPIVEANTEDRAPDDTIALQVLRGIEKSQVEILSSLRMLSENKSSIESLANSLNIKETELGVLRNNVAQKERQNESLISEIAEMKKKNDDMTERLRTALQMDGISKSQELTTLKNDISEALKLEYADYTKSRERPCDEDLFEAYRATLSRIFKVLRRFGISCE